MPPQGKKEDSTNEVEFIYNKLIQSNLPEETLKIVNQEMKKLRNLDPRNQEYHVSLNYLTTMSNLPWNISQQENQDPSNA